MSTLDVFSFSSMGWLLSWVMGFFSGIDLSDFVSTRICTLTRTKGYLNIICNSIVVSIDRCTSLPKAQVIQHKANRPFGTCT
jgi:hypothetical protein